MPYWNFERACFSPPVSGASLPTHSTKEKSWIWQNNAASIRNTQTRSWNSVFCIRDSLTSKGPVTLPWRVLRKHRIYVLWPMTAFFWLLELFEIFWFFLNFWENASTMGFSDLRNDLNGLMNDFGDLNDGQRSWKVNVLPTDRQTNQQTDWHSDL